MACFRRARPRSVGTATLQRSPYRLAPIFLGCQLLTPFARAAAALAGMSHSRPAAVDFAGRVEKVRVMIAQTPSSRSEWRFVALVLAGGLLIRLIWLVMEHGGLAGFLTAGEAQYVALSLARTGSFADAYFEGQGPTAHLLPVSVGIAGGILWLFGPFSPAASLVLLGWSLLQTGVAYLLLYRLFQTLGAPPPATRWGLVLLCLVPPFVTQEVIDFRYWESGLAVILATAALIMLSRMNRREAPPAAGAIVALGALVALTFFVAPVAGLAAGVCAGLLALVRWPLRRALLLAAAFACCLALMVVPWAMRNAAAMGEPVLLRSNAGIELAIANHADALSDRPPERVFSDRVAAIHPIGNAAAHAALRERGGEVRYSARMGAEARAWIAAHPTEFARLYLRHLRQFLFPEPWQFYFSGWEGMRIERATSISLISLLGLAGLALGLARGRRGYWLLAAYIAVVALSYAPFQPMARYIYLTYGLFAFLAADLLARGTIFDPKHLDEAGA